MYQTEQVSASELRDLEARLVHRLDRMDTVSKLRIHALEARVEAEKKLFTRFAAALLAIGRRLDQLADSDADPGKTSAQNPGAPPRA